MRNQYIVEFQKTALIKQVASTKNKRSYKLKRFYHGSKTSFWYQVELFDRFLRKKNC